MTLQSSGQISLSDLASEFQDTAPYSLKSYYRKAGLVDSDIGGTITAPTLGTGGGKPITSNFGNISGLDIQSPSEKYNYYVQIRGLNGQSPGVLNGTRNINQAGTLTTYKTGWHNRTWYCRLDRWGTSMVRETDNSVAWCKMGQVSSGRLSWEYSNPSGYTQNPYYFTIKIVGKHRTSPTGAFLTGEHWYTLRITKSNNVPGTAEMYRKDGYPGNPGATSLATGGTSTVESGIYYLYDLDLTEAEFYFNANQPGTSSAVFNFYWGFGGGTSDPSASDSDENPDVYNLVNNSGVDVTIGDTVLSNGDSGDFGSTSETTVRLFDLTCVVNQSVPEDGEIRLKDLYGARKT